MALSKMRAQAGRIADSVRTTAKVHLDKVDGGMGITRIDLVCRTTVPGLGEAGFQEHAPAAKVGCPISTVLPANEIPRDAALEG